MIKENETISVNVSMTYIDGRFEIKLSTSEKIDNILLRGILASGVALTIKAEDGPEKQGIAMKQVVDYLNSEFISTDSFEDAKFIKSNS
jgi:hypothetical protein